MESANNGTLSPERLEAALNAVTARYDPDQVILFGSAARGTMTPDSDIDLMVIKPEYDPAGRMRVTKIRAGGESVDVVELGPRTAEKKRMTAGSVERNALHEGMTVHLRNAAVVPVAVGPSWFEDETGMVKSSKLKPDESGRFLKRAVEDWQSSNSDVNSVELRCYLRHRSMEQALKGLLTAQGREFDHVHALDELWTAVEAEGHSLPAKKDDELLGRLTGYAEGFRYDEEDPVRDRATLTDSEGPCRAIVEHARSEIPELARKTREALALTPRLRKPSARLLQGKPIDHS